MELIRLYSILCCLLLSAYCLLLSWSRHARPEWALSTLDDARGAHRLFLIGGDGRDVAFLQLQSIARR